MGTAIANYTYGVGAAGNRTNATEQLFGSALNSQTSYSYDPVGNRLSRGITSLPLSAQTSTFDADDRLNSDTYDANGNTLVGSVKRS